MSYIGSYKLNRYLKMKIRRYFEVTQLSTSCIEFLFTDAST